MTIDVESVCTDKDLEVHTLGHSRLQALLPEEEEWLDGNVKTAAPARKRVLLEVMAALEKRRPPIRESDILHPSDLREAVCFGALAILYRGAIEHDDSPNIAKASHFQKAYIAELSSLQPRVSAGVTASSISARVSRG